MIDPVELYADDPTSCPVAAAVGAFSGKWKPIILHLLAQDELHFANICRALPKASKKVLTEQLREMENDGIVVRRPTNENRPRVFYSLSRTGKELAPIMLSLYKWQKDRSQKEMSDAA